MISFRGLKQIIKHLFFLLEISERCPSISESAKEEVEEEEKDPSIYESAKEEVEEEKDPTICGLGEGWGLGSFVYHAMS